MKPPWLEDALDVKEGSTALPMVAKLEEPGLSTAEYMKKKALEGLALSIGNIADAPSRVYNLGKAALGASRIPTYLGMAIGRPESDFMPELSESNAGTNAIKRLLSVTGQEKPEDEGAKTLGGVAGGVGASILNPGAGVSGVAKNLLIGGLAGGGAEVGGELTGDSPTGKLAGGLLGGMVLPSFGGLVGVGTRTYKNLKDAATSADYSGKAQGIAEKIIDRQLKDAVSGTPDAAKSITEALALKQKLGAGFNPSVAEMANSPGMIDMQRRYTLLNPTNLNSEVARDAANKEALRAFYQSTAPAAATGPSGVRSSVNQALSGEADDVANAARKIAGELPKADQFATGKSLVAIAEAEKQAAKGVVAADYQKAFDAAGTAKVIDASPVVSSIEDALGTKLAQIKPETAPNTFSAIKRIFGDTAGKTPEELNYLSSRLGGTVSDAQSKAQISLQDADAIRKALNADIATGAKSLDPLAATRLRNLGQVHSTLDDTIANSGLSQEAKDLYGQALTKYRENYVPRFKEGANLRVFKETSLNEPRILPDKFVSEYFKPDEMGGMTRAGQFGALFGKNPEAAKTAEKGILDLYRNDVVNKSTGIIDPAKHDQFIKSYGRTLDAFKSNGVNVGERISSIGAQAEVAARAIDKFGTLAKSLKFDTTDDLVNAALKDPKVMGNVSMRMTPEARDTFKRIIMDKAWESGNAAGMQKYITDNQKTLKMILPEKHLSDLSDIAKGLSIVERAPVKGMLQSGGPDIVKNATGVSTATIWSQWRATTGGRQAPVTAVFNLAAPVMNKLSQQQFGDVMERALHDPKTAEALRNFLVAETPAQANFAGKVLSGMKLAGGIAWDSKGPLTRTIFGTENYAPNLERGLPAIAIDIQKQEQQ